MSKPKKSSKFNDDEIVVFVYNLMKEFISNPNIKLWEDILEGFPCRFDDCENCPMSRINCFDIDSEGWEKTTGMCVTCSIEIIAMCESEIFPFRPSTCNSKEKWRME